MIRGVELPMELGDTRDILSLKITYTVRTRYSYMHIKILANNPTSIFQVSWVSIRTLNAHTPVFPPIINLPTTLEGHESLFG